MPGLPPQPRVLHLVASVGACHPRAHSPELQAQCAGAAPLVLTFAALVRLLDTAEVLAGATAMPAAHWDSWHSRLQLRWVLQQAKVADADADARASGAWRAVRMLREAGVDASMLQRAAATVPIESAAAAAEVVGLLRAYEARLAAAHARDEASAWQRAMAAARQPSLPDPLAEIAHVWVDRDVEAVGARLALLLAFAQGGRQVSVELAFDAENPAHNPWTEAILGSLEASGEPNLDAVLVPPPLPPPLGDGTEARLPRTYAAPAVPVQVLQCAAGEPLVAHVVHVVHGWVQAGTPPHRIAVVLPKQRPQLWSRATHQARLLHAFAAAGLPVEGAEPGKFADHPVGKLLQQLLALVAAQAQAQPQPQAQAAVPSAPSLPVSALGTLMAHFGTPMPLPPAFSSAEEPAELSPQRAATWLWRVGHRRLPWDALTLALASMDDVGPAAARALAASLRRLLADVCGRLLAATTLSQACLGLVQLLDVMASQSAVQPPNGVAVAVLRADEHARLRSALAALAVADRASGEPVCDAASWQRWVLQLLHETPLPVAPGHGGVALRTPRPAPAAPTPRSCWWAPTPACFPPPPAQTPGCPSRC